MNMTITTLPWYVDFANYVVCGIILEGLKSYQRKKFLVDAEWYFWDKPYFLGNVLTMLYEDVSLMKKIILYLRLAMHLQLEVIMGVSVQLQKCINVDITS